MRPIDADALIRDVESFNRPLCDDYHMKDYVLDQILTDIKNAPTIDAEPVRHGKWIPRYIKIAGRDYKHGMQCSVCAEPALDVEGDDYLTDYCPWCGARMDAERKEE